MDKNLLITFIALNIINVVIQTAKSLITVRCGKTVAALANAIAYGLYTIVTIYTLCDLPIALKAIVVALCNLVGVYVVKWIEEKTRKTQLWKVEATLQKSDNWQWILEGLKGNNIPHNYIDVEKYIILNCYCATKEQSKIAHTLLNAVGAKYFVSASKGL